MKRLLFFASSMLLLFGCASPIIYKSDWFEYTFDDTDRGMNFSGTFGDNQSIWYPLTGELDPDSGDLRLASTFSRLWSSTPSRVAAIDSYFTAAGYVDPQYDFPCASGLSVRCVQEL